MNPGSLLQLTAGCCETALRMRKLQEEQEFENSQTATSAGTFTKEELDFVEAWPHSTKSTKLMMSSAQSYRRRTPLLALVLAAAAAAVGPGAPRALALPRVRRVP